MGKRHLGARAAVVAGAGVLLGSFAVWSPSQAQTASPLCFSASTPETEIFPPPPTNLDEIVRTTDLPAVNLNQFDPALGTLTSVTMNVTLSVSQPVALFNQNEVSESGTVETSASGVVTSSAAGALTQSLTANLTGTFTNIGAFSSGTATVSGSATGSSSSTDSTVLTAFTGTGTTGFTVTAEASELVTVTPDTVSPELAPALATVTVQVCYAFQPVAVTTTAAPTTVAPTTAAPTTTPATTVGPVTLPNTGSSGEAGMTWVAAALVAAGGALLVVARRRRPSA